MQNHKKEEDTQHSDAKKGRNICGSRAFFKWHPGRSHRTEDMISKGGTAHTMVCYVTLADKNTETSYTDATGALSVHSLEGIQ